MEDIELEQEYNDFWKDIVENEDGTLNKEQVKKELFDYSMIMDNCTSAYIEMSDGMISKPNTMFFEVQHIFNEKFWHVDSVRDDIQEIIDNVDNLEDLQNELRKYFEIQ